MHVGPWIASSLSLSRVIYEYPPCLLLWVRPNVSASTPLRELRLLLSRRHPAGSVLIRIHLRFQCCFCGLCGKFRIQIES